jgi:hypothetical protein
MARTAFETELNLGTLAKGTLSGGITEVSVKEMLPAGPLSNQILQKNHDWQIQVNWELVGTMLDSPFFTIPGNWVLKAYLEGWGEEADELDLPGDTAKGIPVVPAMKVVPIGTIEKVGEPPIPETEWRYVETFTIKANDNPDPGPYRLAVTITYVDDKGVPGPMAGFIEFKGMVQIYE